MKLRRPLLAAALTTALAAGTAVAAFAAPVAVSVDDTPPDVVVVAGTTVTRTFDVSTVGTIADVDITLKFQKVRTDCANPGGQASLYQLGFTLYSPSGTRIAILPTYTFDNYNDGAPYVEVTLDDEAVSSVGALPNDIPQSGTFWPMNRLSLVDGEAANGTWRLEVKDLESWAPLCYYGATLDVDVTRAPVLDGAALADGLVGSSYSGQLHLVSGSAAATSYTVVSGLLPAGLSLSTSTGAIWGTPTSSGVFTFGVRATNAEGDSPTEQYSIAVSAPPSITGDAAATATVGEAFSYLPTLTQGYPAGAAVTLASGTLPAGLSLNATTGEISGTPTGAAGTYPVTLTAGNGVGTAGTLNVAITVNPGAVTAITLTPAVDTVQLDTSTTFAVTGVDSAGNATTVNPADVTLVSTDANDIIFGHTVTFAGAVGDRTITATHTQSGASDTSAITVWKNATIAGSATATATIGEEFHYAPTTSAGYPTPVEVSLASGTLPGGLSLNPSTGEISGVPVGSVGPFPVTLSIVNGTSVAATLDVTIDVTAGAPVAIALTPSAQSVDQGQSLTFTVAGVDSSGNPTVVDPAGVVLSSSMASDVIDGLTVTFPHASPHTITATHLESGTTSSVTIEVIPAVAGDDEPADNEPADNEPADDELSGTGPTQEPATLLALALGLAAAGALLIITRRRWRA